MQLLYSPRDLLLAQENSECITVDCRFDLANPSAGFERFLESHIPGAVYANLNQDLSGPVTSDSGRHPLPDAEVFAVFLARSGWCPGKLLVAYDDAGGAIAARLWWLMKYFGHDHAALLDGGMDAWKAAGFGFDRGHMENAGLPVAACHVRPELVLSTAAIAEALDRNEIVLADARASERFNGEIEPLDPIAGHIPGAVNYPLTQNLTASGIFKPVEELRNGLQELVGDRPPTDLVHMCGSGVTACLNLFAAELAGLEGSRLYVGSWSEWIRDPSRPVELKSRYYAGG